TREDYSVAGEQFKSGVLSASKKQLLLEFRKNQLQPPIVHKGWFHDLIPSDLPNNIAFAFLDGDLYQSINDSLRLVWDKLIPRSTVTVDDYASESLPGVERAVINYLQNKSKYRDN